MGRASTACPCGAEARQIARFPTYLVCAEGHVSTSKPWRGRTDPRVLTLHPGGRRRRPYLFAALYESGRRTNAEVHVLVATAFLSPKSNPALVVRHLDGDPLNNAASNLRWGTPAENAADRIRHDRHPAGERNTNAKLTDEDVRAIYRRCATETNGQIAADYGVSLGTISHIRSGRSWRHVTRAPS